MFSFEVICIFVYVRLKKKRIFFVKGSYGPLELLPIRAKISCQEKLYTEHHWETGAGRSNKGGSLMESHEATTTPPAPSRSVRETCRECAHAPPAWPDLTWPNLTFAFLFAFFCVCVYMDQAVPVSICVDLIFVMSRRGGSKGETRGG
jgi:hypothetical protein